MKRRILALVLSVAMVLGAVSFTAFADTTATTNPYASGKNDTAQYLMKLPESESLGTDYQWTSGDIKVPMRVENGERFLVYDNIAGQSTFNTSIDAPKFTYGQDKGIPSEVTFADDFKTMWVAVRVKINDFGEAYEKTSSALRFYFKLPSNTIVAGKYNSAIKFLDLKDGSMTWMYAWSGAYISSSATAELEFTGDLDGYFMIPMTVSSSFTADAFRNEYSGMYVTFYNGTEAASGKKIKESSWKDKEFLLGDSFIVSDPAAFQKNQIAERQIKKYAPNGAADTAYYAVRIGGYRTLYYNAFHNNFNKNFYDPTVAKTITDSRATSHITTLSNGDRAIEIIPNPDTIYKNNQINIPTMDTYELFKDGTTGSYRTQTGNSTGVPTEDITNLADLRTLAFRVATNGGNAGEEIKFALTVGHINTNKNYSDTYFAKKADVQYLDVKTGEVKMFTTDASGYLTITENIDGYLIIPIESFSTKLTAEKLDESWAAYPQFTRSATRLYLTTGFDTGRAFYYGDVYFVGDKEKFRQYHCPHVGAAAGERVEATCQNGGYTPVTCNVCGNVEKTQVSNVVPCNQDIPVGNCAPTCTEPGMTSGAKCSWCKQYVDEVIVGWQDPLGHDMKAGTPVVPNCVEDGYTIYSCQRTDCDHEEKKDIKPMLGHAMVENTVVTATCQIEGYTGRVCTNPGCTHEDKINIVQKLPHDKDIDIEAIPTSCTHPGRTAGKRCSMCKQVQEGYEYIWAVEHNSDANVKAEASTCSKEGHEAGKACSDCGKIMEGCDPVKKLAHNATYVKTVKPTDNEKGYDIYNCKDCGADVKKNYVPALNASAGDEEYVEPDLPEEEEIIEPDEPETETETPEENKPKDENKKDDAGEDNNLVLYIIIGVVAALLLAGGAVLTIILVRKKKK